MTGMFQRAWYHAPIDEFVSHGADPVLGRLLKNATHTVESEQRDAWAIQYDLLVLAIEGLAGHIFWEFSIPRMGRRIDVLLLVRSGLIVLEFKVGLSEFPKSALDQAWDYALDLKNFHETSHAIPIVPVVYSTDATAQPLDTPCVSEDQVSRPLRCGSGQLRELLAHVIVTLPQSAPVAVEDWIRGSYKPTPTILEAARALYSQHSVEEIVRADAGAKNLAETSSRIDALAERARREKRKIVCFVTGVPGAGKTLVGLDVANRKREGSNHAVFLSGNGPLVAVLREALTRDEYNRRREKEKGVRKGRVAEGVKAFIQNVHHFRDEALIDDKPPSDRIAIFDEAQRAWDAEQTSYFMKRKKNRPGFSQSEPEFLIRYMDRHQDWAMVVCLIGGGQEINKGEAGIDEWVDAVARHFPEWEVYASGRLLDAEYGSGRVQTLLGCRKNAHFDDALHLSVSMRSFRAENLSSLVKAILDCERAAAVAEYEKLSPRYPIYLTRSLESARRWLRSVARGSERYGLVCSSKALRLKPHAVDVRVAVDPVNWFLNDRSDVRSSFYLEDVATEFQVQGLELDWACVAWDADLRVAGEGWGYHDFRGQRWERIHQEERKRYLKNAYRVLLTRARQGLVIFVPPGNPGDPTRPPDFYDPIYAYLRSVGIAELPVS